MTIAKTSFTQSRWSLDDLIAEPRADKIEAAFTQIDALVSEFEALRPQLREDIPLDEFMGIARKLEEIMRRGYVLNGFAGLWYSEDTQNQAALGLMARVDQYAADLTNRTLFFSLWWKQLSDGAAARLMDGAGDYRYWLEEMRHFRKHTLSEAEEKIVNLKNVTGVNALQTLYSSFTNRYTFKVEINGQVKELTRGEVMMYARHHDPEIRARAYQELYRVYGQDGAILGQMYQTLVRDWRTEQMTLRGFEQPIAARNLVNDLPDEVINTLLDVCQKNVGVFQRFFKLKARWLGVDRLRRYDLYAPVVKSDKAYAFTDAANMVLDSFEQFDPRFAEMAQRVFAKGHMDSEVRKGKRGGAFCSTILPELTPWVLLNYQGRADDVATMAHELGHAIHSMMADQHSLFTQHACLPLAETASTFGEMMLVDRLLQDEKDEDVRRDLLFGQVDDAYATIQRQAFFALFERKAHEMIQNGASVDELAEAYIQNLRDQFGDAMEVNDEFRWEWVSIPHIFEVPFYVYAYAFGQLLVLSLYQQYRREGESFKPRYMALLAAGGSEAPMAVLDKAGVDVRQAAFWQGGFDVIADLVASLEAIPLPAK